MKVVPVYPSQNILGEGPLWNKKEKAIYWVDIEGKKIQRFYPLDAKYEFFDVPLCVSVIAFREKGGMVCGTDDGFYFWDTDDQIMTPIMNPEEGKNDARFNDGKVDRKGRLWAGTMTPTGATSALYRLDANLEIRKMVDGTTISNGIGWSPDNSIMYFVDSNRRTIYQFDYDLETGMINNQRPFVQIDDDCGVPDGLTVDNQGYLWCAIYDGWKVIRYSPNGDTDLKVKMPVSRPSSCTFGGEKMNELYITSISEGLTPSQLANEPMAGDLFKITTNVKGILEPEFAG